MSRVVSLDLEAKPYAIAQPVRIQLSGNPCRVPSCGYLAGDGYVCPSCAEEWEVHLGNVTALVEDLELAQRGQVRFGSHEGNALVATPPNPMTWTENRRGARVKPGKGKNVGIPLDAKERVLFADPKMPVPADDQTVGPGKIEYAKWAARVAVDNRRASYWLDRLRNELVGQIRLICDVNSIDVPKLDTTVAMSRWLLGQSARIAVLPEQDGWGMVHDLDQVYRDCVDCVDAPARRKYVRVCECGLSVWATRETVRCACGKVYDVEAEHDARMLDARDYLVTLREAATLAKIPLNTVRSWANPARGRLDCHVDLKGDRRVRFGDVADLAATRRETA